jgi:hypothetical protein
MRCIMSGLVLLGCFASVATQQLNTLRPDRPLAPDLHFVGVDRFSKRESLRTASPAEPSKQGPDMPQPLGLDTGYQDRVFISPSRNKERGSPAAKLAAESRSLEVMEKQFREMQHSFMLQNGCKKDCHLVPDNIAAELRERARNMMQTDKSTCPYHGLKVRHLQSPPKRSLPFSLRSSLPLTTTNSAPLRSFCPPRTHLRTHLCF